jgi:hypothetical protein
MAMIMVAAMAMDGYDYVMVTTTAMTMTTVMAVIASMRWLQ